MIGTLTTEQVRRMVGVAPVEGMRDWQVEFDRWLVEHDKSVRLKAIEDFREALSTGVKTAYSYAD